MNDQEILKVARELAVASGISFDDLAETDIMRGAYLHNAEEAIKDRQGIEAAAAKTVAVVTCPRCQDKAYIGENPCMECNPLGLPVEQVHPGAVVEISHQRTVELPLTVITRPIDLTTCIHENPPDECMECKAEREWDYELEKVIALREIDDNSDSGTQPDNKDTGSADTGQPAKPQKPKAKSKARAKGR